MESNKFESLYSAKVKAGKRRTYFFDVRKTKGEDYYVTLTESTRKFNEDGYDRHKIFLYKEDFNRFLKGLEDVVNHVKNELMPEYDYDEFSKRYEEDQMNDQAHNDKSQREKAPSSESSPPVDSTSEPEDDMEDEMTW